jgi:hypothetical protein
MVAKNVTKNAIASSNIRIPPMPALAKGPIRTRCFSVVSSSGKMVSSLKEGGGDIPEYCDRGNTHASIVIHLPPAEQTVKAAVRPRPGEGSADGFRLKGLIVSASALGTGDSKPRPQPLLT